MPGIEKKDIEVNATESEVVIKAEGSGRKYYKSIAAPSPVDPIVLMPNTITEYSKSLYGSKNRISRKERR